METGEGFAALRIRRCKLVEVEVEERPSRPDSEEMA